MELRDVMLILHIVGVATWLGANMVQFAMIRPVRAHGGEAAAAWARMAAGLGRTLYMPAGLLVLATGIVLVLDSSVYTFGSLFVTIGMSVVIVGAILGPVVFGPGGERVAGAIESGDTTAVRREESRVTRFAVLDTVLVLFALAAMVMRWG